MLILHERCPGGGALPALRFVMLRDMVLELGMGIGMGVRGSRAYFRSDPINISLISC